MSEEIKPTIAELLARIEAGWDEFNAFINTLTPDQLTQLIDAAGWTVKDHIIHLAMWEDGVWAMLDKQSRREYMNIDREIWKSGDFDRINAVIQQRYKDMPLEEVFSTFQKIHQRLIEKIQSLSDEDLMRPYRYFQPGSSQDQPVIGWIVGNTFEHYAEHTPWIAAIVEKR